MRSRRFLFLGVSASLLLCACAGTVPAPSAEQYFADAKHNLTALDFDTALKNFDKCIKAAGDQPAGQQCGLLRAALLVALAEGSKQMAESYTTGRQQPGGRALSGQFGKMRADYYGMARTYLMDAMQAVMGQRNNLTDKGVPLALAFPEFAGSDPPVLFRIQNGQWVGDMERYRAELEMKRNALARTLAVLVGAGEDVHKGHAVFEKGGVDLDPRVYLVEMSNAFVRLSEIFGPRALDDQRYRHLSLEVVNGNLEAAMKLLAAKPDKDLEARAKKIKAECDKQLKSLGA